VCCSVLQRVAACCRVLQGVAVCGRVWQCVTVCYSVLQCVSTVYQQCRDARVCESMSMYVFAVYLESVSRYTTRLYTSCVAGCCSVLQYVTVRYSVLQCVAVCGSVWLCVAVCYSELQRVAVYTSSVY